MLRPLLPAVLLFFPGLLSSAYQIAWNEPQTTNIYVDVRRSSSAEPAELDFPTITSNRSPVVTNSIPDQTHSLGAGAFSIDLAEVFSDTDGNRLTFSAVSNDFRIASTNVVGSILTVTPKAVGSCRIRTTARDDGNGKADDTFTLIIRSNLPPAFVPDASLDDQVLYAGGTVLVIDLSAVFFDPDGDDLRYDAASDKEEVAEVTIEDAVLKVYPNDPGETRVSLSADDQNGGLLEESFTVEVIGGYPSTLSTEVRVTFDDYRDQGSYRMIALPGDQSMLVSNTTSGDLNQDWVAFAPDTSNTGQLVLFDGSDLFVLRPGRGLWFLSKRDWVQPQKIIPTVPLSKDGTFEIPLHAGWNIISNPLDKNILWSTVAEINSVSQGIWKWDHGYQLSDTLYATTVKPEAYYFNNLEGLEKLTLPYFFSRTPAKTQIAPVAGIAGRATLEVASLTTRKNSRVAVLWEFDASEGFDRFDQFAPPAHFNALELAIYPSHPDFTSQPLAVESRPAATNLHRFDLQLQTGQDDWVTFDLQGLQDPIIERAILINRLDAKTYDLHSPDNEKIQLNAGTTPFSLFIGEQAEIEKELETIAPAIFTLKQNYPNPFSQYTTIEFSIPSTQYVDLSIYDLMGRRIATLRQGEVSAGLHQVQWHGLDQQQNRVANGVYFYRLQTNTWTRSHKMTLIR